MIIFLIGCAFCLLMQGTAFQSLSRLPQIIVMTPKSSFVEDVNRCHMSRELMEQDTYRRPSVKSPSDMYLGAVKLGVLKASTPTAKIFRLGLITGAFIGFGACFAITVTAGCSGIEKVNPGLNKLIYASIFPIGMMMTTITGGELFTGNTALVFAALAERQIKLKDLVKSWSVSYAANFIGSILFAALIIKSGILNTSSILVGNMVSAKVTLPFDIAFIRAILCNWLVCMAVYMSSGCSTLTGKAIAIWFPIFAFVTMGLEHSVANMFLIPLGMMCGAKVTIAQFLLNNLLPVTLGNIVGAVLCVMAPYGTSYGMWMKNVDTIPIYLSQGNIFDWPLVK